MPLRSSYATITPALTDYLSATDDPGGTPLSRNVTIAALRDLIQANLTLRAVRCYSFQSFSGSSGINYIAGFYDLKAADLNLTNGSPTGTVGTANGAYGAHAILVAGGVGAVSGGSTGTADITVTGTSITDAGVRNASASEIIVADVTAAGEMAANVYHETALKWIGQVTYTIAATGDHTTFNADFNVGLVKYEDWNNTDFTIKSFEVVGLAGANDSGFNIVLCEHSADNWIYHVTAFVAPANPIVAMNTDYNTEINLVNGEGFAYKRVNLSKLITGTADQPTTSVPNGYLIQVTTGANAAVQAMDVHVSVIPA